MTQAGEVYKHFKGHVYEVVGVARDSHTMKQVVVYRGLYEDEEHGANPLWVRPLDEFEETVVVDGVEMPRFTKIDVR